MGVIAMGLLLWKLLLLGYYYRVIAMGVIAMGYCYGVHCYGDFCHHRLPWSFAITEVNDF